MSDILVKSLKPSRKNKKVILPCGMVEFDENYEAEITVDQLDQLGDEGLQAHFLEVITESKQPDDEGGDNDDEDDEPKSVSRNALNKLNLEEAQEMAREADFPEEEWGDMGVTKLRDYLYDKLKD